MLVLTRRSKQGIVIDGKILVKVLKISGAEVRLGVRAPRDLAVDREENLAAAPGGLGTLDPAQAAYRWIDRILEVGEEVRAADDDAIAWDELGRARAHLGRAVEAMREYAKAVGRKSGAA